MRSMIPFPSTDVAVLPTATLSRRVLNAGACVGSSNPDAWFPPEPARSGSEPTDAIAARRADYENTARALCADCPMRAECLELALREEHDLPRTWVHGIRGGTAPWQRARLIVRRRRIAAQQSAETTADHLKALRVSNHRGTLRIPVKGVEDYQVRLAQAAIDSPDEVA